jgi:glutaredoxin 3
MKPITIYTTKMCPYCFAAKRLLKEKGAEYSEIDVSFDREARSAMTERAGGSHTVPQIFIGDRHVGGCDDLYALDHNGNLDELLAP